MGTERDDGLLRLVLLGATMLLVFSIWPELDLQVSDAFRFGTNGFPLSHDPVLAVLRAAVWNGALVVVAVVAALAALRRVRRGSGPRVASCPMLQATGLFVLGPGVIVNGVLKTNWGRARPADVSDLGGEGVFTQAFHMVGSCSKNCSFVSGEAALAMAVALVLWHLARRGAFAGPVLAAGLTAFVSAAAMMRVATGRHFLSDVVFACLFMAILARLMLRENVAIRPVSNPAQSAGKAAAIAAR